MYVDDILVWGATKEEHNTRLRNALQLVKNAGLTFNASKYKFGLTEVDFLGDVISRDGIRPNGTLSMSLAKMLQPTDKAAVHRMLGVANYFGKYIPHLAERTKLLRRLIKKDTKFEWSENHANEWTAIAHGSAAHLCWPFSMLPEKEKFLLMLLNLDWAQHFYSCTVTVGGLLRMHRA